MEKQLDHSTSAGSSGPRNTGNGSYEKFIGFRLAVMRAIAISWRDPEAEKHFIKDPKAAFKKYVNYDFPFQLELKMMGESGQWDLPGVNDWRCIKRNKISLKIPPPPQLKDQPEALAAFMARQYTFLG